MIDVTTIDDGGLKNLIDNHQRRGATDQPLYQLAVEEFHRRHGGELDIDRSIAFLRAAAAERQFVSYGQLAEANGALWGKVRYPMNTHLWALVCCAHAKGWPMLSAMVVNKQNLDTGDMEPETLAGFAKAAADLGHDVGEPRDFLKAQQEACFSWGGVS